MSARDLLQLQLRHLPGLLTEAGFRPLAALDAALLTWLAIEGPTPRARLAQLLWPDKDPEAARNSLRQRLFQLRRAAGREVVVGASALALADGISHDVDAAGPLLGDVPAEDFAPGEFAQWLEAQRARRRECACRALAEGADRAEQARDWYGALALAQELLLKDALSEDAHRRVMRLHYLAGDRAAALLAFDRCERVLKDEVGARPSAETLALLATVEASAAATRAVGAPAARPMLVRPPRLIGREKPWRALLDVVEGGGVGFVEGEAGLGKSRLLGDVSQHLAGAALSLSARPGDAQVPYATLLRLARGLIARGVDPPAAGRRVLARLLPELGDAPAGGDEGEAARLHAALEGLLVAARADGLRLVAVDDLHFADGPSADTLVRLAAMPEGPAWVLAARPAEWGGPARDAFMEAATEARVSIVDLQPLTLEEIEELVDSLGLSQWRGVELAPALLRHTGGNPLFVLETLRATPDAKGAVPALARGNGVMQLVARRLTQLSPPALRLARCAALAGQDFRSELATELLGVRPLDLADAWAELEAAQVLRDQSFAHDLVYEAALASVPPPLARQLRGQIAAWLAAHEGPPERIAAHWLASGQPQQAVPCLIEAGRRALRALRPAEALEALTQAADLLEAAGDRDGAFEALDLYFDHMPPAWDEPHQRLAERLATLAATPRQQALAGQRHADLLSRAGDFAGCARVAEAALRTFEPTSAPQVAALLLQFSASGLIQAGRLEEAVHVTLRALALAETSGDDGMVATCAATVGAALDWAGRFAEALPHHLRAFEQRKRLSDPVQVVSSAINLASNRIEVGRLNEAKAYFDQVERMRAAHDLDLADQWPAALAQRARLLLDLGHYNDALRGLEDAHALFERRMPAWLIAVENMVTTLWMRLGQRARALQWSRQALARLDGAPPSYAARALQIASQLDAESGVKERLALAESVLAGGSTRVQRQIDLQRSLHLAPEEGYALALRVRDAARADGVGGIVLDAEVRAAQAALRAGGDELAAAHAQAALLMFEEVEPFDLYRAEIWLVASRALRSTHPTLAASVVEQARAWIGQTARERVPAEFRDSFMHRNPVNRELLTLTALAAR